MFEQTSETAVARSRRYRDTQELIRTILNTPLKEGAVFEVDGDTPMSTIAKKNTDVQTRMFMQIAGQAISGDIKSAQFLMKYGGLEPAEKQTISVELPQFIDDVTPRAAAVVAPAAIAALPPAEGESEDDAEVSEKEAERWRKSSR